MNSLTWNWWERTCWEVMNRQSWRLARIREQNRATRSRSAHSVRQIYRSSGQVSIQLNILIKLIDKKKTKESKCIQISFKRGPNVSLRMLIYREKVAQLVSCISCVVKCFWLLRCRRLLGAQLGLRMWAGRLTRNFNCSERSGLRNKRFKIEFVVSFKDKN